MAGEGMFLTPGYILHDMPIDFFDFQFTMNADGSMKECKFNGEVLDKDVGKALWRVREKYMDKVNKMIERKKMFEEKQKNYMEHQEAWIKNKAHLQGHIRKSEAKLSEYKNVILAFGKLATCNSISK